MDWVDGIDLAPVLHTAGRPGLAPSLVLHWLADAAAALTHLHTQDPPVVHGDVKPANLILGTGRPRRRWSTSASRRRRRRRAGDGERAGTPRPSSARARRPVARATCTRSRATAFALLTGAPPTGVRPAWEGIDPSLAAELEDAIRVGLATDPARRPDDARRARRATARGMDLDAADGRADVLPHRHRRCGRVVERSSRGDGRTTVAVYDELVATTVEHHGGRFLTAMGRLDGLGVRHRPADAVEAACRLTHQLAEVPRPNGFRRRAAIGLHTGEAHGRDGDYSGPALHGAARVRDLAAAGEVLVSESTADVVRTHLPEAMALVDVGDRVFARHVGR